MKSTIFLFLLCILSISSFSQFIYSDTTWERWYGVQYNNEAANGRKNDLEHYDKGYLFHANYEHISEGKTVLKKTDINGYFLWERKLDSTYLQYISSMKNSTDGGMVMCGISYFSGIGNPWVAKLNACMEVEWCKLFEWPEYSFARDLAIDHNGDIIVLCAYYGEKNNERTNIIKLNPSGNIIWKGNYATVDAYPMIWNATPDKILIGEENDYYIAGEAEWPNNNDPSQGWGTRSLFIKVKPNGEEEWILPFGIYDSLYSQPWSIHNLSEGNFVAIGGNYQTSNPVLMYFNEDGEELSFVTKHIMPEDYFSTRLAGSIQISDTSFISIWRYLYTMEEYNYHYGYIKFDTALNIIDYKEDDRWKDPANLIYSYNDKIVTVGRMKENNSSGKYDIYMSKRNQDFTYDTVYPNWTGQYDSLCPEGVVSGFLPYTCHTIVGIDELQSPEHYAQTKDKIELQIQPNPAHTLAKLIIENENEITDLQLSVYNQTGEEVFQKKLANGIKEEALNISQWSAGIYVIIVRSENHMVGSAKLVVE